MKNASRPERFLGLNHYTRKVVHDPAGGEGPILHQRDETNVSGRGWEICPQGLNVLLTWLHADYPQIREIHVSENGESVHHIAFMVGDTESVVKYLADHGIAVLQQGLYSDGSGVQTYVDSAPQLGVMVALLQNF